MRKYDNLREKTVFDFCDDDYLFEHFFNKDILKFERIREDKGTYIAKLKQHPRANALQLEELAHDHLKDQKLYNAVWKEFEDELTSVYSI